MMKNKTFPWIKNRYKKLGLATLLFCVPLMTTAAEIIQIKGHATAASINQIQSLKVGDQIKHGQLLSSDATGYVWLKLDDGGNLLMRPNTEIIIQNFTFNPDADSSSAVFRLNRGGVRILNQLNDDLDVIYKFITDVGTIDFYGGSFQARLCKSDCDNLYPAATDGLYLGVEDGEIEFRNYSGNMTIEPGQFSYAANGKQQPQIHATLPSPLKQDPMPSADPFKQADKDS